MYIQESEMQKQKLTWYVGCIALCANRNMSVYAFKQKNFRRPSIHLEIVTWNKDQNANKFKLKKTNVSKFQGDLRKVLTKISYVCGVCISYQQKQRKYANSEIIINY